MITEIGRLSECDCVDLEKLPQFLSNVSMKITNVVEEESQGILHKKKNHDENQYRSQESKQTKISIDLQHR